MLQRDGPLPVLFDYEEFYLMHLSLTGPGIYLKELQHELPQHTDWVIDTSTICRAVKRLGMTHQHIQHIALQQSEAKRAEFETEMNILDTSMMIWIDEVRSDWRIWNSLRKYGCGIRGLPPQDYSLQLRGKHYSAIDIMSTEGIEDVFIADESVDGETFLFFVRNHLVPILQPFDDYNAKSVMVMHGQCFNSPRWFCCCLHKQCRSCGTLFTSVLTGLQSDWVSFWWSKTVLTVKWPPLLHIPFNEHHPIDVNSVSQENCNHTLNMQVINIIWIQINT